MAMNKADETTATERLVVLNEERDVGIACRDIESNGKERDELGWRVLWD
jgi:hypothetical protein